MISFNDLATLNAILNMTSFTLLLLGYRFIRQKKIKAHRITMSAAFGVSSLFLISYLVYHYNVGSVPFKKAGWIRPVYFIILISHVSLAAPMVPMVLMTLFRAMQKRFDQHRTLARWTFPVWVYVSITGVIVYLMLYHL